MPDQISVTVKVDISTVQAQINESVAAPQELPEILERLGNNILNLSFEPGVDIVLGEPSVTTLADGSVEIVQPIGLGGDLERLATALRARDFGVLAH
ncbi:hypothetical protein MishRS11D_25620 [Methylomagnum ishizawai]|nr:hypothetical protein [Methylomagnum ishizawai]BBL75464.1 hypothetical protein MishRS11D_25620 [Methylomagnum ishizawai]